MFYQVEQPREQNQSEADNAVMPVVPLSEASITLAELDKHGVMTRDQIAFHPDANAKNGGWLEASVSGNRVHTSGTSIDGSYIPPDRFIYQKKEHGTAAPAPRVFFQSADELIAVLGLSPTDSSKTVFNREGFGGTYQLCRENDGSLSIFYSGGKHLSKSGNELPAQTFHHGIWDLDRREAVNPVLPAGVEIREKNASESIRVVRQVVDQAGSEEKDFAPAAVNELKVAAPAGDSPRKVDEYTEVPPPVWVESARADGTTETAYGFAHSAGDVQKVFSISERDPQLPEEIRQTYQAAQNPDGTLTADVWLRSTPSDMAPRSIVRSDGSVLVERDQSLGKYELFTPDLSDVSKTGLKWRTQEMEQTANGDFVETAGSSEPGPMQVPVPEQKPLPEAAVGEPKPEAAPQNAEAAGEPPAVADKQISPELEAQRVKIRKEAEALALEEQRSGLFAAANTFTIPPDPALRSQLVAPFLLESVKDTNFYVFPRRFRDRASQQDVSGVLIVAEIDLALIDPISAYKAASAAYGQLANGGKIETWINVPDTAEQVNLRSDGSFVHRETAESEAGIIYRPMISSDGITWEPVPAARDADGRYQPMKR